MDSYIKDELEMIKPQLGIKSTSKIIKLALNSFIAMNPYNPERPNPKLIISYNIFKELIKDASDGTLQSAASISFENSQSDTEIHLKEYKKLSNTISKNEYMNSMKRIKDMLKWIFSKEGLNWFDVLTYQETDNNFIITGEHHLSRNFSKFIKYLLIHNFGLVNYSLTQEDYSIITRVETTKSGNSIERQIDGLKLIFTKI
jgi:hypothetical protein